VDEDALKQNADIFLGKHDFAAIGSRTTPAPRGTTVRTVTKAEWKRMPDGEWQFEVRADAFLYRMVRRLVFVQVAVAQGRCSVEKVQHALSKQGILLAGLAPAHGLTLVKVSYGSHD
jgi:tRNA pseudouridine38-40 synthase